jgi:large subunit ribosomal protein L9
VKVILTEFIPSLGDVGAVVEVRPGYGRNFLIPQGKALLATPGNMAQFEKQRARFQQLQAKEKQEALDLAARLAEVGVTIAQRVGEKDRLYGSVTNIQIAEALAEQGFDLDRKKIDMAEPIKTLGEYAAIIRLHPEVKATVKVTVVPEEV